MQLLRVAACAAFLYCGVVFAQEAAAPPAAEAIPQDGEPSIDAMAAAIASLEFQRGRQSLPQANVELALDERFVWLAQKDARRVLEEFWGNPPDESVLGLVVPSDTPLTDPASWVAVVTYSDEGYVSDEEASEIDYDAMLKEMQQGTADENEARRDAGYPTVELVGWASPPRYDAAQKKLHWAKELDFEGSEEHTVNYDVRVLGRRGYLSLNAVGGIGQLEAMQSGMQHLIPQVAFTAGERYADFDASTDKVAAYGVAALVGGALAAKTGLLGKLLALLLAAKKIVIPLAIGGFWLLINLFRRKKNVTAA